MASKGGTNPSRIFDAHVVRIPLVAKISLMASGIPVNDEALPAAIRWSAISACSIASRGHRVINAFSLDSTELARSRQARVNSTAEISRRTSRSRASATVNLDKSKVIVELSYSCQQADATETFRAVGCRDFYGIVCIAAGAP